MKSITYFSYIIILILCTSTITLAGRTEIRLERIGAEDNNAFIGDIVRLRVVADTHGEKITGIAFYLTFDSKIFHPILHNGLPFKPGLFLKTNSANFNHTHRDSIHLNNEMSNGIPGFQLDYYQSTGPRIAGQRPYVQGAGDICTFELEVVGLTDNIDDSSSIVFDFVNNDNRLSTYYRLNEPGNEQKFSSFQGYKISTSGFKIFPPFPDTVITPGTRLTLNLADHIQTSIDSLGFVWTTYIKDSLPNTQVQIDSNKLIITSGSTDHGLLKFEASAVQAGTGYEDSQEINIGVNIPPAFQAPLPVIEFNEEEQLKCAKSVLFYDADDPFSDVTLKLESANIHSINSDDSIIFYANENWHGEENVRFYLEDKIQAVFRDSVDTVITIRVISVNDPPVLDLSSIKPTTVQHSIPKSITMKNGVHVADVDDGNFTWSVLSEDPSKLSAAFNDNILQLEAVDLEFEGSIPIIITVKDDENATDSDTVTVLIKYIEYAPPVIGELPVIYKHPDSTCVLHLNNYVSDEDTPKDSLQWSFRVLAGNTLDPDNRVSTVYIHADQRLEITAEEKHHVIDNLVVTVSDNVDSTDTKTTRLLVFGTLAPLILPSAGFVMASDTLVATIMLDSMVFDLKDQPEDINWKVIGVDLLKRVSISDSTHIVTIESDESSIGIDTVTFIATNSLMLSDSAAMIIRCMPRSSSPVIIALPDTTFYWNTPAPQTYIDLDDYVWGFETPVSLISWQLDYDRECININVTENNMVQVVTNEKTGQHPVIFTAIDLDGNATSDTVIFHIIEDTPPVWDTLERVVLTKRMKLTLYRLTDKCTDDLTASSKLTFGFETESPQRLNIVMNPVVTLSLRDTTFSGSTWLRFSATDEHANTAWSNTIIVSTSKSQPPVWLQIPVIQFDNSQSYSNLYLKNYCRDPENQELSFYGISTNPGLNVEIIDSTSQVIFTCVNGFSGDLDIVFRASDPDANITSTVVTIVVSDAIPPAGSLTYYYNPVTSRRINFVVTADATAANFTNLFTVNSQPETLSFSLIDSDLTKNIWAAAYKFQKAGIYRLSIKLADDNGFVAQDSLNWTIDFGKAAGGCFSSYNRKISVEYPENSSMAQRFFSIMESHNSDINGTVYSIASDENQDELLTLTCNNQGSSDPYYSFYKIEANNLCKVETYTDKNGNFQTLMDLDQKFIFAKSQAPAHKHALPGNELLCYPNPFNSAIKIKFLVKKSSPGVITIYNILGKVVYLGSQKEFAAGIHSFTWHGTAQNGTSLSSGIYLVRVKCGMEKSLISKVTLIE